MRAIALALSFVTTAALMGGTAAAQRVVVQPRYQYQYQWNAFWLLRNSAVQQELKLDESQKTKIAALQEETQKQQRELYGGLRDVDADQRQQRYAEIREKAQQQQKQLAEQIDAVLSEQQAARLEQLRLQMQSRWTGAAIILGRAELADRLGVTDEQRERLRAVQQQAQKELQQQYEQLRRQARRKVLESLTPEQQAKWQEMLGDPFEFPQVQRAVQPRVEPAPGG